MAGQNIRRLGEAIRNALPAAALGIVFVDMLGLDVHFDTLATLTSGRKLDLLLTLQVSDFTRNAENALDAHKTPVGLMPSSAPRAGAT